MYLHNKCVCDFLHHHQHFSGYFLLFAENLRKVTVLKTVQGLGLSVTGGVATSTIGGGTTGGSSMAGFSSPSTLDAAFVACSWPGLIRIKKIFPHGAAWQTGQLVVGDVLLAANGQPLTGCTNYVSHGIVFGFFSVFLNLIIQMALEISSKKDLKCF